MADQTRNAWLYDRDGRAIIHVNMPAKDEDIPAIGARGRMDHVAFDCRDPDAMEARLTDLGIAYRRRDTRVAGLTQIVLKEDRKSVVEDKRVAVRVDLGGRRIIKKK